MKDKIITLLRSVPITDKTYPEYIEAVAERLIAEGYRKQRKGEWEKRTFIIFDSVKVAYRCSECNTTWDATTHFCPNCGAKMKGAYNEQRKAD